MLHRERAWLLAMSDCVCRSGECSVGQRIDIHSPTTHPPQPLQDSSQSDCSARTDGCTCTRRTTSRWRRCYCVWRGTTTQSCRFGPRSAATYPSSYGVRCVSTLLIGWGGSWHELLVQGKCMPLSCQRLRISMRSTRRNRHSRADGLVRVDPNSTRSIPTHMTPQIQHWPSTGPKSDTSDTFVRVIFNGHVVDMECAKDGSGLCRLADFLSMVRCGIPCHRPIHAMIPGTRHPSLAPQVQPLCVEDYRRECKALPNPSEAEDTQ